MHLTQAVVAGLVGGGDHVAGRHVGVDHEGQVALHAGLVGDRLEVRQTAESQGFQGQFEQVEALGQIQLRRQARVQTTQVAHGAAVPGDFGTLAGVQRRVAARPEREGVRL